MAEISTQPEEVLDFLREHKLLILIIFRDIYTKRGKICYEKLGRKSPLQYLYNLLTKEKSGYKFKQDTKSYALFNLFAYKVSNN